MRSSKYWKDTTLFVPKKAPSYRLLRVAEEVRFVISEMLSRGDLPPVDFSIEGVAQNTSEAVCTDQQPDSEAETDSFPFRRASQIPPITVTEVTISPNLQHATVYVMPLGGREEKNVLSFLKQSSGSIRKFLSQKIHLKYIPNLRFQLDTRFDEVDRLDRLFKKL